LTTETGQGAGTDLYCLRRASVKGWNAHSLYFWNTVTGKLVPSVWDTDHSGPRKPIFRGIPARKPHIPD
jgi:hypothetical protein